MKRSAPLKALIVTLMVAIGVASVVSAVQSRAMAYDMAIAGDVGSMGAGECFACGSDDKEAPSMDCTTVCHATSASMGDDDSGIDLRMEPHVSIGPTEPSLGLVPSVDPSPPKSILI